MLSIYEIMQQISITMCSYLLFFSRLVSELISLISINDVAQRDADHQRAASEKLFGTIADIDEINRI